MKRTPITAKPIRILMLLENSSFPEDSRVLLQARTLKHAGYQVTVICPTEPGSTKKIDCVEGIPVYRYPAPPELGGLLGYALEYGYSIAMQWMISVYLFIRHGFDTIHMHTPPDMIAVIPAFFQCYGKKFIYDLHDLSPELYSAQRSGRGNRLVKWLLRRFESFASRRANLSIATNQSQRDIQVRRCGVSAKKFYVVRNGPNQAFLVEQVPPRAELVCPNMVTLGYVGVMGVQDGVDYLIHAMDVLVHQRKRTNVRAVLVGNGAALPELKQLTASLNLEEHVIFTGRVPFSDVPGYIAAFDICCTPDPCNAYNDSCTTIKTMEYMALGKPVVCFETTENMKTAGDAALYACDNDPALYAIALERLIDDRDLRNRLGSVGRQKVIKELAWEHQAKRLLLAYQHLHSSSDPIQNESSPQGQTDHGQYYLLYYYNLKKKN
ncbi:MAG TPA: glycosyltransferase WbuB [Planctomycetaceae bacterium]|nr:glycosyltransferase WbuB [Planctomycetaceae bacterium]